MKHCWGIQPWAALYEGFVVENLIAHARGYTPPFYRSAEGAELDLVLQKGSSTIAFEVKASSTPAVQRGFWNALEDIQPDDVCVIGTAREAYPLAHGVMVRPLREALRMLREGAPS
jgi:predicted AAA+ superfamily ATPase